MIVSIVYKPRSIPMENYLNGILFLSAVFGEKFISMQGGKNDPDPNDTQEDRPAIPSWNVCQCRKNHDTIGCRIIPATLSLL